MGSGHVGARTARLRRSSALLAVTAVTAAVAGCSGPSDAPSPRPEAAAVERQVPPPAEPTDPAATTDPRSPLADLAALAEQAAQSVGPAPVPAAGDQAQVLGADISWPQCPVGLGIPQKRTLGLPLPLDTARFVVIGLTNGPGFYANPCLGEQVAYARGRGLLTAAYAVLSYPDAATVESYGSQGPYDESTATGLLQNVGWSQARFSIASMVQAGLETPMVWLDVESVPGFDWSADPRANAAVVQGAARGYAEAGYRVGVYSTPYLWQRIVGDLSLGVPEWRPAGPTSRAGALARCGEDWVVQGGAAVLVQWVEQQRDQNVTCPRMPGAMADWFHRF